MNSNRMNRNRAALVMMTAASCIAAAGCHMNRVFYHPNVLAAPRPFDDYNVVLAADFIGQPPPSSTDTADHAPPPPKKADPSKPPKSAQEKPDQPNRTATGDDASAAEPDDSTKRTGNTDTNPPYTAPGPQYRRLAAIALGLAAFGFSDAAGSGRESAESQFAAPPPSVIGRPGLSAPAPTISNAVIGRPGLQQGFAALLGPAADRNIFTAHMNPLSGANGRCQDLVNAGFFNRDRAACETHFRR